MIILIEALIKAKAKGNRWLWQLGQFRWSRMIKMISGQLISDNDHCRKMTQYDPRWSGWSWLSSMIGLHNTDQWWSDDGREEGGARCRRRRRRHGSHRSKLHRSFPISFKEIHPRFISYKSMLWVRSCVKSKSFSHFPIQWIWCFSSWMGVGTAENTEFRLKFLGERQSRPDHWTPTPLFWIPCLVLHI